MILNAYVIVLSFKATSNFSLKLHDIRRFGMGKFVMGMCLSLTLSLSVCLVLFILELESPTNFVVKSNQGIQKCDSQFSTIASLQLNLNNSF